MPSYISDAFQLTVGILYTLIRVSYDAVNPLTPRVSVEDLDNPSTLAKYLGLDVLSVSENSKDGVGAGAGGTGTCRRALIVTLRDKTVLHLFAKTATNSLMERVFLNQFGVYDNELAFYQNVCPQMNKFFLQDSSWSPCPKVYCARKLGSTNFLIILEDTRFRKEGCCFQDMKDTFQRENGCVILKEFSMLHAKYWRQAPRDIWRYSKDTGKSLGRTPPLNKFLASLAMKKVKERYGAKLTIYPDCDVAYTLLLENYETVRKYWCSNPSTLCHGDSHIGNVFFSQDKTRAGFVDYQCVQEDNCLRDVSYYLINSCSSALLADVEGDMLKEYLKVLRQHLIQFHGEHHAYLNDLPSYDEAFFIHRTYALWCFLAWTICCGFLDVVQESFVVHAMQRMLDTCHRLNILEVMHTLIEREKNKRLNR